MTEKAAWPNEQIERGNDTEKNARLIALVIFASLIARKIVNKNVKAKVSNIKRTRGRCRIKRTQRASRFTSDTQTCTYARYRRLTTIDSDKIDARALDRLTFARTRHCGDGRVGISNEHLASSGGVLSEWRRRRRCRRH